MSTAATRPAALAGAATAVVLGATVAFPGTVPLGVVVLGALLGTGTGLLAVGLVLTYRSHRVVNFAYGGMGGLGAGLAVGLHTGQDWPWPSAFAVGLATGLAAGALTERVVLRRLERSPRLVVTVATIGLAQLLAAGQAALPFLLGGPALVGAFETPLSRFSFDVHPLVISGNDLALLAFVPLALGSLTWFLLRTDAGVAVRGLAENGDRARLLGVPAHRLSLLVWTVAGGLAAFTVLLRVPSEGMNLSVASTGPQVMLPALAAAVVAGLRSMPRAFAAGVALGVVDQVVRWNVDKQATTTVVLLAVVLVALLAQHRRGVPTDRAEQAAEEGSWSTAGAVRPLPQAVRRLPEVRLGRGLLVGLALVAALGLPLVGSPSQLNVATVATTYGVVAVSLVVLTGWSGTVSLGQVAILGTGGLVAGDLIAKWNVDFFVAMLAAGAAGGLVAVLVAVPALRVSGQLLAVTTLTFAVAVDLFFLNPTNFPALVPGSFDRPVLLRRWDMGDDAVFYYVGLALLVVAVAVARNLSVGRTRRVVVAGRDNDRAAAVAGVHVARTKLTAFVVGGVLAGMAGAVHATALGAVGLRTYDTGLSILAFTTVVIGGITSVAGALAATVVLRVVVYLHPQLQLVATGVGVLVVLLVVPGGLAQAGAALRDKVVQPLARRRGIPWDAGAAAGTVSDVDSPAPDRVPVGTAKDEMEVGTPVLLSCSDLRASYGSLPVLFGVDLDVREGEMLALLGTNGAGKSTLLRAVTGLLPPTGGAVTVAGGDVTGARPETMVARGVALVPGGRGVFPTLTVAENLRLACWPVRHDAAAVAAARDRACGLFPALAARLDQRAGDLSGGEQQMLSLAMALAVPPRLLCIDELALGLAPAVVAQLVEVVTDLNRQGTTVVVVEQSVDVALLLAERAVFLEKGRVRFTGATAGLLERPDILRSVFLGSPSASASVSTRPAAESPETARPPALEATGLVKRYGGLTVVDGVDLTVPAGAIVGLIGHNGAGKTTILDLLSGLLPADGGTVRVGGLEVTCFSASERALAGLGRSFQDARLYPGLTVADTVAVALDRHLANRDPVAAALRLPAAFDVDDAVADRVDELLAATGLDRYRDHLTGTLSTGTRRMVELACVLAQAPGVVLLDEPSAGVAQREAEALAPLLRRVQADLGCAMLVVEHDMGFLGSLCDQLVALETGRVIASGAVAEVLTHPRVVGSYLGVP